MVFNGPEPPEDSLGSLTPPPGSHLHTTPATDSEEEESDYAGYEPLPQGPEGFLGANEPHDYNQVEMSEEVETAAGHDNIPPIDSMDQQITRDIWSAPRSHDPIEMDSERAQQVMSAMANFVLPQTSIPEWAQCISEDQWKQRLNDKIETLRANQ